MYKCINKECEEYITEVSASSIDLVLFNACNNKSRTKSIVDFVDYNLLFKELNRVLKDNGYLFIYNPFNNYLYYLLKYFDCYFEYIIIKNNNNDKQKSNNRPRKDHNIILVAIKKDTNIQKRTYNKDFAGDISTVKYNETDNIKKASIVYDKSKLLYEIIKVYTKENDVILDISPDCDITLFIAYNLKRKCIGIENNKNKFETIVKNLKNKDISFEVY